MALTTGLLPLGNIVVCPIFNPGVGGLAVNINVTLASITANVRSGDAPDLDGRTLATGSFDLAGGDTVPISATFTGTGSSDEIGATDAAPFRLEEGNHISLPMHRPCAGRKP